MAGTTRGWATGIGLFVLGFWGDGPGRSRAGDGSGTSTPAPTYGGEVAAVLERRCSGCHRKGRIGPFVLETYGQAKKRAKDLATVVAEGAMPPWKPTTGVGPKLKNDRSMPSEEIAMIAAWAEAGAPEGPALKPAKPRRSDGQSGWTLGTPDVVLEMREPFEVPADGADLYRCFVIPTHLGRDVMVSAVEYRPGNARVVHHMTCWVDAAHEAHKKDMAAPGPGYSSFSGAGVPTFGDLGGWAPGNEAARLPDGIGRPLPNGADVILQVHYHPGGKPESDRSRIGLYLAKGPVRQTLQWNGAGNFRFQIPAGQARVEVKASWLVPVDVVALAVAPHMHRLGRDMTISVTDPNGRNRDLIQIRNWDVNWQNTYYFETPVELPKGSIVRVVAHFDNSAANPGNPNHPPRRVGFGEGSKDEMCVGYIGVVKKGQDLTRPGELDDLFGVFVRQRQQDLRGQRLLRKGAR